MFAHPDDEVFCVGGTLAQWAEAGCVSLLIYLGYLRRSACRGSTDPAIAAFEPPDVDVQRINDRDEI